MSTPRQARSTAPKRGAKQPRTGWRRWVFPTLKWGSLTALALLVLGAVAVAIAYARISIPQPNEMADAQVSILYYADGKTELDRLVADEANRESVPLTRVPKEVQEAHLAAEDRSFYSNNGISPSGILRAVRSSLAGDQQVGGSTITQQYVKNYFLSSDRTLTRKAKEILISVKIDGQLSKEQILENYLNTIYYGRGAYGIQSAARVYFGKDVSKLTVAEGAVLASVINAPSLYDPAGGPKAADRLSARYAYVLDGMVEEGWLSAEERQAITDLPKIQPVKRPTWGSGTTGYISSEVRKELVSIGLTEQEIDRGGLRITTTIDKRAQDAAVAAMKDNLPDEVTGGLVAIRPGNGAVVAMYGGADYRKSQLNTATQAILQAGSNFKPFAVLAAVRDGVSTLTRFDGNSPQRFSDIRVENFGHRSYGSVDMRRMIGRSVNTAFVELNERIGPDKTREAAIDAGIPANTPGLDDSLTNVLGSSAPHVIDMASAYSTIASQGVRSKPYFIAKVTSTTSDYSYTAKPVTQRAFDKDVAADVMDAMTYTVRPGGTATKLQGLDRDVAGKTGTSEENRSVWFSGFVPQLAVSIGMYKPDEAGNAMTMTDAEGYNLTGGTIPADIFMDFMQPVLEGVEKVSFPERAGVGDDKVRPVRTYSPPPATQERPTTPRTSEAPTSQTPTETSSGSPTTTAPPTLDVPSHTATRPPVSRTTAEPPRPTRSQRPSATRTRGPGPSRPAQPSASMTVAPEPVG